MSSQVCLSEQVYCLFVQTLTVCDGQVALVRWTESVGLTLVHRDLTSLQLKTPSGQILSFHILQIFPFTSESKRMGIIVRVGTFSCQKLRCVQPKLTELLSPAGGVHGRNHLLHEGG